MTKRTPLTPGQKAARTKRLNGLDLSAIAAKALKTRKRNVRAAAREATAKAAARVARKAMRQAA